MNENLPFPSELDRVHGHEVPVQQQEQPETQRLSEQQKQLPKMICRHPYWVQPCRCNPTAV